MSRLFVLGIDCAALRIKTENGHDVPGGIFLVYV